MEKTQAKESLLKKQLILALIIVVLISAASIAYSLHKSKWSQDEVTIDNIKTALSDKRNGASPKAMDIGFPEDITRIEMEDQKIYIYYKMKTYRDDTDLVKKAGGTAIYAGSILYENPAVENVELLTEINVPDKGVENVVNIELNRGMANQVDWKGLALTHDSDPANIYRMYPDHYIAPFIRSKIDKGKILLPPI
ncbi:MAG: hypothetical protein ACM3PE_03400 [Deltaproteobacteria bacterium]